MRREGIFVYFGVVSEHESVFVFVGEIFYRAFCMYFYCVICYCMRFMCLINSVDKACNISKKQFINESAVTVKVQSN